MKIKVDPEFSKLLPAVLENDELETDIKEDGRIFEPLIVWKHQHILLDGHRRHGIMRKHPHIKAPKPVVLDFESRQEAHDWVINHQLSKRNVTEEQRRQLIGQRYNLQKQPPGAPPSEERNSATVAELSVAQKIAVEHGISERTVRAAGRFAEAVDAVAEKVGESVKDVVLSGKVKATTKDLESLAELPANTAKAVAREIASGEVKSVGKAIAAVVEPAKPAKKKPKEEEILDALKSSLPKSLHPIFAEVGEFKSMMSAVSALKGRVTTLAKSPAAGRLDVQELERLLTQAHSLLRFALPYTECPKCKRKPEKKCAACFGSGWLHESGYKSCASDADKKWLESR